ncbi:putative bifunctional diguanylate cyclase/phosphodiesterase [Micromonospora saelicesensis]|uniref:Diguanylate cyclase (GGDEF) domain-containing protein n=1 Tax=Micromonospora saelicesensis TaxID=285676 RepID=A0A1C4V919_9ACTN|nr:bifunctional diguanylate cyclase/phosphodiesterase [Micromonospora saelicesensis]RAO49619.1 Cyclic-guanylate-specific phosphodiesterase [Micromonospora saelicesensis]SCE80412.1 diguanylate cyclase (GGDEF) domain-containing protein [Micromonospora saelicesensis]
MTLPQRREIETDRRLLLLVGLVVVVAAVIVATSLPTAFRSAKLETVSDGAVLVMLTLMIALGTLVKARVRIRSTTQSISWNETAIIVGAAIAPTSVVVLCTAVGIALASLRLTPIKLAFGIGKNVIVAWGAGTALAMTTWTWPPTETAPLMLLGPLALAYLVAALLDDLLAIPVIALASQTRIAKHFRSNLDLRLAGFAVRFAVAACTLLIVRMDPRLLLAVPPLVLSLHLAYSARIRGRTEQQAWQRLARTTDALNVVDLDNVLTTAVTQAAELFSADEVEIELRDGGRTVRGGTGGITFDGPTGTLTDVDGTIVPAPLEGHDRTVDVGMLRLRFRGPVQLSEREQYTLRTFASALCTAVRNAQAYAELARVADEHAYAASHDALTGLANRRHLLDEGTEQLSTRHADGVTALVLIDLNHFKEVNDTLGHAAGDQVLVQVADRLRGAAQPSDLVARLGGDEFAVLMRGLPAPAVAAHRAETLLAALHEPFELDGMRISVEASGGISGAPSNGGMAELLRRADVAMYQAKRAGQRISTYAPTRDTADLGRLTLGGDLPRAVADHEFVVNFQPIVDLGTGEVTSAEALARWHHPTHGLIDPLRFLEAVERSGLLPAFAEAILDQALIAAVSWRDAGFDVPVAVNVSPRSLLDARFPGSVLARLRAHDLPPDRLVLELTETLTLSQLDVVDRVLSRLRDEGVRLALDDFGTGYSSLSLLSRIPVHELKIDRSFVTTMESSAEAAAVIRSTLDLGRSLDLDVVAEGVESEPQRRALWELGCVAGQGHLFARPMPSGTLLAAMQRGSGGRPGTLAAPLHDTGAVIRLSQNRRQAGRSRPDRLPHLPA